MMNAKELIARAETLLFTREHIALEEASAVQLHDALSSAAMEALAPVWAECEKARAGRRQACYLSAEYLMGRMVYNNLFCMGLLEDAKSLLAQRGVDIACLEDIEDDAFGNGSVLAVPYDMPVVGYGAKNIGTLRLWQTESLHEIDFPLFNAQKYAQAAADKNRAEDITKFLYPNDTRPAGRQMRVKQQYVLVSASIQDMLRAAGLAAEKAA